MNKPLFILGALVSVVIIAIAIVFFTQSKQNTTDSMIKKADGTMMKTEETPMEKTNDTMMETEDSMEKTDEKMMKPDDSMMKPGTYVPFTEQIYADAVDKKRVLFFHATWCPTCKAANEDFTANLDKIPSDVVLLKTDYDSQRALKQKYNITYQHTFVQVDKDGKELTKWNGGGVKELAANIK